MTCVSRVYVHRRQWSGRVRRNCAIISSRRQDGETTSLQWSIATRFSTSWRTVTELGATLRTSEIRYQLYGGLLTSGTPSVIRKQPPDWKWPLGRPSHIWLRAVEADLGQLNIGLASAWREAAICEDWWHIVDTAVLQRSTRWKTKTSSVVPRIKWDLLWCTGTVVAVFPCWRHQWLILVTVGFDPEFALATEPRWLTPSAKEAMFLPLRICLSFSRTSQKKLSQI